MLATESEAKCLCNNCSKSLQFPVSMAGQKTTCPACQMETLLYIPTPMSPPPNQRPASGSPKPIPASAPDLEPEPAPIEQTLDNIGQAFFIVGILSLVISILTVFGMAAQDDRDRPGVLVMVGVIAAGLIALGQGLIIRTLFRAAAEHIRLTRRIAEHTAIR